MHPNPARSNEHALARFADEYQDLHNISVLRRREQLALLRKFATTLDNRPLTAMKAEDLRRFIGAEMKAGLHPNTGRKHLGMFRSFINWARDAELIDELTSAQLSLVRNPRGSTSQNQPKPYKSEEIPLLYAALAAKYPPLPLSGRGSGLLSSYQRGNTAKLHTRLWCHAKRLQLEAQIALALECGLRCIEVLSLSIDAMHPDNEELVVLTAKQEPGRKIKRTIPYLPHTRDCAEQWLEFREAIGATHDSPWLTLHHGGGNRAVQLSPLTHRQFRRSLNDLEPRCHWQWHRLRHTAATEWLRAKVPIEKVRLLMGHSSIDQTLAYAQILKGDMMEAFDDAQAAFDASLRLPASPYGKAA